MKEEVKHKLHPVKLTFSDKVLEEEYMQQKNDLNRNCTAAIRIVTFTITIGAIINMGVTGNLKPIAFICANLTAVIITYLLTRFRPTYQELIGACHNVVVIILVFETFMQVYANSEEYSLSLTLIFSATLTNFLSISISLSTYFPSQIIQVCISFPYIFIRVSAYGEASIPLLGMVFFFMGILKIVIYYVSEKHQRSTFLMVTSRMKKQKIWKHIVDNVYPQSCFLVGKESEILQQKSNALMKKSISISPVANTLEQQTSSPSKNMIKKLNTFFFDGQKQEQKGREGNKKLTNNSKFGGSGIIQSMKSSRKSIFNREKDSVAEYVPAGKINAKFNVNSAQEMSEFLERFKVISWEFPTNINIPMKNYTTATEFINYLFEIGEVKKETDYQNSSRKEAHENLDILSINVKGYHTISPSGSAERTYVNLKFTKFQWEKKPWILVFLEDTTAQEENKHLKELDTMKDRLLASVTHDLRTPLNMVIVMLDSARTAQLKDELETFLSFAEINAKLLSNLISDILDFSLIKENKMKLILSKSSLKQIIDEVFFLMKFQADQKKIDLLLEFNVFDDSIFSDARRIKQILINLISNAIKFTKQGFVMLRIDEYIEHDCLKFEITDSGNGIQQENIPKLFQPFATFDNKEGSNKNGIGLGLSICKTLVTQLGPFDKVHLSTILNKGSRFGFFLFKNMPDNVSILGNAYKAGMRPEKSLVSDKTNNYMELLDEFRELAEDHGLMVAKGGLERIGQDRLDRNSLNSGVSIANSPARTEKANNRLYVEQNVRSPKTLLKNQSLCVINPTQCTFNELIMRSPRDSEMFDGISNHSNAYKFNFLRKKNPFRDQLGDDLSEISISVIEERKEVNTAIPIVNNNILRGLNILIVDDNPFNLFVLEKYLIKVQNFRINIFRADSGEQSVELYSKNNRDFNKDLNIDVIFLDCEMPGISGYEASEIINNKMKNENYVPAYIVACTAHQGGEEEKRCHDAGMAYFFVKPVSLEEIEAFLKSLYGK